MEFHRRTHDPKRPIKDMITSPPSHLNFPSDFMDDDAPDDDKKRTPLAAGTGARRAAAAAGCQAERCTAVLTDAKRYHRRHKVCEFHAKAPVVLVAGLRQRFCQQCSRFHELSEFDEAKRSCRRRLAGHNERRRKSTSSEPVGEGSGGGGGGRLAAGAGHQMKGKAVQACN